MIAPRLDADDVVRTARLLYPLDVPVEDPRLAGIDQTLLRPMAFVTPLLVSHCGPTVHFVEWPDLSLGVVFLGPEEPARTQSLLEAYAAARQKLEQLALDCFRLYDPARPH